MLRHGAAFRGLLKTREEHKGAIRKVPPPLVLSGHAASLTPY